MRNLKRILVPVDFSACSDKAFEDALELARRFGAELIVLHVWQPPRTMGPETVFYPPEGTRQSVIHLVEQEARRQTAEFVAARLEPAPEVRVTTLVEAGIPYASIVDIAEREEVGLIVMGTHGRSGLSRFFLGSVAEKVVRHAPCPVLTIRIRAERPGGGAAGEQEEE
jgi:universal stress protein A